MIERCCVKVWVAVGERTHPSRGPCKQGVMLPPPVGGTRPRAWSGGQVQRREVL